MYETSATAAAAAAEAEAEAAALKKRFQAAHFLTVNPTFQAKAHPRVTLNTSFCLARNNIITDNERAEETNGTSRHPTIVCNKKRNRFPTVVKNAILLIDRPCQRLGFSVLPPLLYINLTVSIQREKRRRWNNGAGGKISRHGSYFGVKYTLLLKCLWTL